MTGLDLAKLLAGLILIPALASGCRETNLTRKCEALCKTSQGEIKCELRVAVLLPSDPDYEISLDKVLPVLDLAILKARALGLLPDWLELRFFPQDDRCDATYALLGALTGYSACVHVFFGPACDYSVAGVGRITKFLNTPLITTGAFTYDFVEPKKTCQDEYFMIVRTGSVSFRDIAFFSIEIMDRYKWKKIHLLYDTNGQSQVAGRHTCQLMMKSMVEFVKKREDLDYGYTNIETTAVEEYPQLMKEHVGTEYGVTLEWRKESLNMNFYRYDEIQCCYPF